MQKMKESFQNLLQFSKRCAKIQRSYRGVVQLVERQSPKLHVQSSSLCAPAKKKSR